MYFQVFFIFGCIFFLFIHVCIFDAVGYYSNYSLEIITYQHSKVLGQINRETNEHTNIQTSENKYTNK